MTPVGLAAVLVLAVGGLYLAGVLRARLDGGVLELGLGPEDRGLPVAVDLREGILADASIAALALATASLVSSSHWVAGSDALVPLVAVAFAACFILAKLAPRSTTYWLAVEVVAVAILFGFTAPHVRGPADDFAAWIRGIRASVGLAALVSLCGAAWMAVAWSVYWVARKHNALLALAPMAVALLVEILNDPNQASAGELTVIWLLLATVLLLRMHTAHLRERWRDMADSQVWVHIASRGAVVIVALIVVAVVAPPMSTVDLSVGFFHGRDQGAGTLGPGTGPGNGPAPNFTQTGYSERVAPGGTLVRSSQVVMKVSSDFSRPVYWRGINLYSVNNGVWSPGRAGRLSSAVGANTLVDDGTTQARNTVHATIEVQAIPESTIFWPGDPLRVDQPTVVRGDRPGAQGVATVEAAYAANPIAPGTTYTVEAAQSTATEDQLRQAGTDYPPAVRQLTGLAPGGNPSTINPTVAGLARQVAGTGSPYDQAQAIETWLRTQMRYQLKVNAPPAGVDPVVYFLLSTHTGYCEYFASSMGEMVRSLGIPVRLVSGYGPGQATPPQDQDRNFRHDVSLGASVSTLRASDAHTWVEVYFPKYGWVPFEPTPDPIYPTVGRGPGAAPVAAVPVPAQAPPAPAQQPRLASRPAAPAPAALGGVFAAVILALLLVLLLARAAVGPVSGFDLFSAWRRMGWLAHRLGVPRRASDTPLEFATRLAAMVPWLEPEIVTLGRAMSRELYSGRTAADGAREADAAAWQAVRAELLRLLVRGVRRERGFRGAAAAPPL